MQSSGKKLKLRHTKQQYIIGIDDKELRQGIQDRTITTTVAGSEATSGVGTTTDFSHCTGGLLDKQFILPSGDVIPVTKIAEYPFNVR